MNQIVNSQALLFITCIQIGFIMGILFDLIRIFRKLLKHSDLFVQLEDLVYWIICAFIGFYMLYINNYAAIRPFVFLGILLGGILYFTSLSLLFMKVATVLINRIRLFIHRCVNALLIPIHALIRLIKIPLGFAKNILLQINFYKKGKLRIIKRKWYHAKAEIRTDFRLKKAKK